MNYPELNDLALHGENLSVVRVQDEFERFIVTFKDAHGEALYINALDHLLLNGKSTIEIDIDHLAQLDSLLNLISADFNSHYPSDFNVNYPSICESIQLVAKRLNNNNFCMQQIYVAFLSPAIFFSPRIPKISHIASVRLGLLVSLNCQVIRTYPVRPDLCRKTFSCQECGSQVNILGKSPHENFQCSNEACGSINDFYLDLEKSCFGFVQQIFVKGTCEDATTFSNVIIKGDFVNTVQRGETIRVIGTRISHEEYLEMRKTCLPVIPSDSIYFLTCNVLKEKVSRKTHRHLLLSRVAQILKINEHTLKDYWEELLSWVHGVGSLCSIFSFIR